MDDQIKTVLVKQPDHFNNLMATLKLFAQSGILTDVALVTGADVFHMHYLILSCFSNYFECVVNNDNVKYFIHIDHKKPVIEAIVDYIYKGMVKISPITTQELAVAATTLRFKGFMPESIDSKVREKTTVICPNHQSQLTQTLWELRQKPHRNDVIFTVENKYKVYAHSSIMGACSPFLLQMFTKCSSQKRKPYIIALPYVEKATIETIIEFCYKGEIHMPFSDISSVYKVADLMGINTLCKLIVTMYPHVSNLAVPVKENQHYPCNTIQTSVVPTALSYLLRSEKLVDIFIYNGEKLFKAHSVILSTYSTYFKQLAKYLDYEMKDVFVLLKDFKARNIEAMLDYIYTGEAKFEGSTEEFLEKMSGWLDLNILPISCSNIANIGLAQVKYDLKDRISSSSTKTVLKKETDSKEDGKYLAREKCSEKSIDFEGLMSRKNVDGKVKLAIAIQSVPDFLKEKDDWTELHLSNGTFKTELNNKEGNIKNDQNVPELAARIIADTTDSLIYNYDDSFNGSKRETILIRKECKNKNTQDIIIVKAQNTCGILVDNIESPRPEESPISGNFIKEIENNLLVPDMIPGNENIICKANFMESQQLDENISDIGGSYPLLANSNYLDDSGVKSRRKAFKNLKCQTCLAIFSTAWDFKEHLSEHPKGNIFACNICQTEFTKFSEMQIHVRSHTSSRPFQCETCSMSFSTKKNLKKHKITHKQERSKEFECEICKNTFSRKQYLQEHKRTHSGNKPYECDICHKTFVGKTGLNHHKRTHKSADEKKCSVCEICGKSFTRHALWTHMKYHNKEHKCEFCSKCFATTASLKIHVAGAHLGHSWHDCNTCGKGFIRKGHLIRHMKTHEGESNMTIYPCEDCSSKFKDESHLKAHVKRKHTEQNTQSPACGICSKRFSTTSALKYHQRLHFLERPHKCSVCEKSFAVPYQLRDHIKLHHSDEKQFQCSVCEKKCATQALLKKHLLTHRPLLTPKIKSPSSFNCSSCNKSFSTKLALSNHSRSHSFPRPYQCNLCRKAFRYQDSLIKHLQIHSSDQSSETSHTKELPCIYTIQVRRSSFASMDSNIVGCENYISTLPSNNIVQSVPLMDLNTPESNNDINVLQLKPVEGYLSQPLTEVEFIQPSEVHSECNVSLDKISDIAKMSDRPYSIIIDENICCNSPLPIIRDAAPSINYFPERSELSMSVVDMELPGTCMPLETQSMVETNPVTVPTAQSTIRHHEMNSTLPTEHP